MRKEFSSTIEEIVKKNNQIIFLTGDLGFMALENVREVMGERFINAGVSEQNMISMAAAMAAEGFTAICYSIAPFAVFRPAEQIRIDVCLHNKNVKIVGNGGGYGYGIMGSTHHAIEDIAVLSSFQKMKCYIPFCNEDVEQIVKKMMNTHGPAYLRLGYGVKQEKIKVKPYAHTRKIMTGHNITIVGMGPVILNAVEAASGSADRELADIFVISEIPVKELTEELIKSILKTGKLLVVEEHVSRGGLGEYLSLLLLKHDIHTKLMHLCARGYPEGLYGSQRYHHILSSLDAESIKKKMREIIYEQ